MGDSLIRVIASKSKLDQEGGSGSRRGSHSAPSREESSPSTEKAPPPIKEESKPSKEEPKDSSPKKTSISSQDKAVPSNSPRGSSLPAEADNENLVVSEQGISSGAQEESNAPIEGKGDVPETPGTQICTADDHYCLDTSSTVSNENRRPESEKAVIAPETATDEKDGEEADGKPLEIAKSPLLLSSAHGPEEGQRLVGRLDRLEDKVLPEKHNMPLLQAAKDIPVAALMYQDHQAPEQGAEKRPNLMMNDVAWSRMVESDLRKNNRVGMQQGQQLWPRKHIQPLSRRAPREPTEAMLTPMAGSWSHPSSDPAELLTGFTPRDEPSLDVILS